MRAPPDAERAAPAASGNGSLETDHADELIFPRHKPSRRGVQLRCEECSSLFNKRSGRRRCFCSDACRKASERAKEARTGSEVECSVASGNALNRFDKSKGCERLSADPYPNRFSVPIDILGGGYRWPGTGRVDRKIWEAILWREVCAL